MLLNNLFLQHPAADCPGCFGGWATWMLLSALLGLLVGKWIWGKYKHLLSEKDRVLNATKEKNVQIEKDYIAAKYQIEELTKDNKGLKASLVNFEKEIKLLSTQLSAIRDKKVNSENILDTTFSEGATTTKVEENSSEVSLETKPKEEIDSLPIKSNNKTITEEIKEEVEPTNISIPAPSTSIRYTDILKPDNLKIIEGVGPKIEDILNKAGFQTWADIANAKVIDLKNILHDAGPRYRIHNPSTWSQQAKLAIKEDWKNLADLQKILSAKKTGEEIEQSIPKIQKLMDKRLGTKNK